MSQKVVLYVYGVFDSPEQSTWPSFPQYAGTIAGSQFNTIVLSTFHVDTSGDLFGSAPLVTNGVWNPNQQIYPCLPALYQCLAASGRTLIYSIGNAAMTTSDLAALETILANPTGTAYANLQQNMKVLASTLGISGIDFDFEPGEYSSQYQNVVTQFTTFCNGLGLFVTYCPFTAESFWIDAQIAAVKAGGSVAWWNLQCYAGGGTNTPAQWEPLIKQNAAAMGVTAPAAFLVPGIATSTPAGVQKQVAEWAQGLSGLDGAFLWQLGALTGSLSQVSQYAAAIVNGLNSPAARPRGATEQRSST